MRSPYSYCIGLLVVACGAALVGLGGCGGSGGVVIAYTGGGLPPGEPDIGGVVVAEADSQVSTTSNGDGTTPVAGAQVLLMRGRHPVGETTTGPDGYFRFENPAGGAYEVSVTAPVGSGLRGARREFTHMYGRQTFLTIVLERE
jgi:hypothetical protein